MAKLVNYFLLGQPDPTRAMVHPAPATLLTPYFCSIPWPIRMGIGDLSESVVGHGADLGHFGLISIPR